MLHFFINFTTYRYARPAGGFARTSGDIGLLRGRFRDHLRFLVSHDRLLSEKIPQFIISAGENHFLRITDKNSRDDPLLDFAAVKLD